LGLSPTASTLGPGTWIARCPGASHTLQMQPKRNLSFCGYCGAKGGIDELGEFAAQRKKYRLAEEPELTSQGPVPYRDGGFSFKLPARADCRTENLKPADSC
jgi:hypothetical protein